MQMVMDAMDLLHTNQTCTGFCLVSSDSEFTGLAQRLRESGKRVMGFGKQQTPKPFVTACERFIYTEMLLNQPNAGTLGPRRRQLGGSTSGGAPIELMCTAVDNAASDDGWANFGRVAEMLPTLQNDFDSRSYGHAKTRGLFESIPEKFKLLLIDSTLFVRKLSSPRGIFDPPVQNPPGKDFLPPVHFFDDAIDFLTNNTRGHATWTGNRVVPHPVIHDELKMLTSEGICLLELRDKITQALNGRSTNTVKTRQLLDYLKMFPGLCRVEDDEQARTAHYTITGLQIPMWRIFPSRDQE
jgi:hypothetical protein